MTDPFAAYRKHIENALDACLPGATPLAPELQSALRYCVLGGGKRLRPLLVVATGRALGAELDRVMPAACAVELIHAYSLVHDDLPAMDDDDLRHGQPSCHVAFGEATAILTGDALQALAFEVLCTSPLPAQARVEMVAVLARAAGVWGMVAGQALDVAAGGTSLDETRLAALHGAKTGALLTASIQLGAIAGKATRATRAHLERFGNLLGLAFQVVDDVLDATQPTMVLGKPGGSDERRGKSTYVTLMGVDAATAYAERLLSEALSCLAAAAIAPGELEELARRMVRRSR